MNLQESITKARGERSMEALAVACGCSFFTVRRWERGECVPTDHQYVEALIAEGVPRGLLLAASSRRVAS